MWEYFRLVPEAATVWARQVDYLIWAFTLVSLFFMVLISVAVIYFVVRYRASQKVDRSDANKENIALELTWTIIPTFMALGFFVWSAYLFFDFHRAPQGAMEIQIIGKQWMWKAKHPNGRREVNMLTLPKDQPVKLIMTSQDVIHSFFIPAFRAKTDVLPGRYTTQWFTPTRTGEYRLFCAEYCGTEHSVMGGWVRVLEQDEYEKWLTTGNVRLASAAGTPEEAGKRLFARLGCETCHMQGASSRGPLLAGVFGREQQLTDGSTVVADEEYIRESILYPQKKLVAGYPPLMPTFKGQVSEDDLMNIVSYLKSLEATESK